MEIKYYFCKVCGKLITVIDNPGTPTICCGEIMQPLNPNTTDAATEKHVPVLMTNKNKVSVYVGEEPHPMKPEHYIQWILLQTDKGIYKRQLFPSDKPVAVFEITEDEKVLAAYEYCNIHKLWMVKE